MCECMYVCMYVCIYVHTYIHTYIHTYRYTYAHIYIHMHVYTYKWYIHTMQTYILLYACTYIYRLLKGTMRCSPKPSHLVASSTKFKSPVLQQFIELRFYAPFFVWPLRTTFFFFAENYIFFFLYVCVSMLLYMCPHTTICVLIPWGVCVCQHTTKTSQ
jgi:hypothetical protein